jgi:hypothetical protein
VSVLALAQASLAVGPSLPGLDRKAIATTDGSVAYYVTLAKGGEATLVQKRSHGRKLASLSLTNGWGIQMATLGGQTTGLSPNGRVLVLTDNIQPNGAIRTTSQLAVIDTRTMTPRRTLKLHGDYSVDALSPDGRFLYLIHHLAAKNNTSYQVVGYDLRAGKMLPGVIADKRQAGWTMAGYAISRAATRSGDHVFTFYQMNDNYPFVHALDTVNHTAVCIGIPADWTKDADWISAAHLTLNGDKLSIASRDGAVRYVLDTSTYKVTTR